jgi:hypothetical protein
MKTKNILTLIVAAGLTSFATHAKAVVYQNDVTFSSSMSSYNIYLEFSNTGWVKYDNGSMPANVYSATGTGISSRDPLGYTIVAVSGQNPYLFAGTYTSGLKFLQGGGVNSYGASSTKAVIATSNGVHLNASLVPNNIQYMGIDYYVDSTTKYFGWISVKNNSDGSQIQLLSAYLNPTANQAVTVGVTHNSGGAVAYGATPVPEPSTYGLIGIGALGLAFAARRRKIKSA